MDDNNKAGKQDSTSHVYGQILACLGILINIYSDFSKIQADDIPEKEYD